MQSPRPRARDSLREAFARSAERARRASDVALRGLGILRGGRGSIPAPPPMTLEGALREMREQPLTLLAPEAPRVSIVIAAHGFVEHTWACLRSIAEHCAQLAPEVVVVDDVPSEATFELAAAAVGAKILTGVEALSRARALNLGAAEARGELLVFLSQEAIASADWLDWLVRTYAEDSSAGIVGSKILLPNGDLASAGGVVLRDGTVFDLGRLADPQDDRYSYLREVDFCSGASLLVPRALFWELGGFDERAGAGVHDDVDLAFRVRAAGRRVLMQPLSRALRYEGLTAPDDGSTSGALDEGRAAFLTRWGNELASCPEPSSDLELRKHRGVRRHVLVVDEQVPLTDQDSGSRRMDALLVLLQGAGDQVTLYAELQPCPEPYTSSLRSRGVEVLTNVYARGLREHLQRYGARYEVVVLSRADMASKYLADVRRFCPSALVAFDTVDLHYLREQRTAELEHSESLRRAAAARKEQELGLTRAVDVTLVVSDIERRMLLAERPQLNVEVVSNVHRIVGSRTPFEDRSGVLFVGCYRHPPNVDAIQWFVEDIWPWVRARLPGVRLHVVGTDPPPQVLALARAGVIVHGWVRDLAPLLDGARISIAPLRVGAGVKGKVNEAMSYGVPVVATSIASEGMNLVHEEDVLIADQARAFAAEIVRLHEDRALWERLSAGGIRNVQAHFGEDVALAALERALNPSRRSRPGEL